MSRRPSSTTDLYERSVSRAWLWLCEAVILGAAVGLVAARVMP